MKIRWAIQVVFLTIGIGAFAEKVEVELTYLSKKTIKLSVDDSVDEFSGVKGHVSFLKNGKAVATANYPSKVVSITNFDKLLRIKKIVLMGLVSDMAIGNLVFSPILEEIYVDYGITGHGLDRIANLKSLRILYMRDSDIPEISELGLTNTSLDYLEMSRSRIRHIASLKVPTTLRFANFLDNPGVTLDSLTIENLNMNKVGVVLDQQVPGVSDAIMSDDRYKRLGAYADIGW